jgi:hypothetical protein
MRGRMTALGVLLIALVGAGIADAHRTSYRTSSSFGFAEPTAALGSVSSPQAGCVRGRLVKLFRKRPGRDPLMGRDRSGVPSGSGDGFWEISRSLPDGRYYARVVKKDIGRGSHRHLCRAYTTSILRYPGGTPG